MIGKTLGHYKILNQLGRGGMGEVYLAEDLSLDRKVALKFLPDVFTGDPERMARFKREAKLLASLNHPNIAAIYGLEQADGKRFLIMEYVEGETLQARISKGALPLDEALAVCRQIAEGLEAAHEKGVIHRDLKPANVMITGEEKVKILDFGLAKALLDEGRSVDSSQSPTITEAMTQPGVVLGTAAYMSPEQAKGKAVDKRADIWAFGCILYECLSGKRVFEGETVTETLAAILRGEPDWELLPANTPQNIRFVLRRCLEKERSRRFRDAADVQIEIEEARDIGETTAAVKSPWVAWSFSALFFLVAALVLAFAYFRDVESTNPVISFTISPPKDTSFAGALGAPRMALSPDGRFLAFTASQDGNPDLIWIRRLDSPEPIALKGTEEAAMPFWSPSSQFIGFFADGKLKTIDVSGGPVQILCDAPIYDQGGTWNRNGVIIFGGRGEPLKRVSSTGGLPTSVTTLESSRAETAHLWPQFLPDGRHFLYLSFKTSPEEHAIFVGSLDSKETTHLINSEFMAVYAPPSYLLYLQNGILVAHAFDAAEIHLIGVAKPIAESVIQVNNGRAAFCVSEAGILAYRTIPSSAIAQRTLVWVDRDGNEEPLGAAPDAYHDPRISPDGTKVALTIDRGGNSDIYIWDIVRENMRRLSFDVSTDRFPIWTPEGKRIVFASNREGSEGIYWKAADGMGVAEPLGSIQGREVSPSSWSVDGKTLVFHEQTDSMTMSLSTLTIEGDRPRKSLLRGKYNIFDPQISPDGRWMAYVSLEYDQGQVFVCPFPDVNKGKWQVSTDVGLNPMWSPDGRELFYLNNNAVMAVAVEAKPTFNPGKPKILFSNPVNFSYPDFRTWDISSDGKRFLVIKPAEKKDEGSAEQTQQINVIVNWSEKLRQKVPIL